MQIIKRSANNNNVCNNVYNIISQYLLTHVTNSFGHYLIMTYTTTDNRTNTSLELSPVSFSLKLLS